MCKAFCEADMKETRNNNFTSSGLSCTNCALNVSAITCLTGDCRRRMRWT